MDDPELENKIKLAQQYQLVASKLEGALACLHIDNLSVAVSGSQGDGHVMLAGDARTAHDREMASRILSEAGWDVTNQLTVPPVVSDGDEWEIATRRRDYVAAVKVAEAAGDATRLVCALSWLGRKHDSAERDEDAETALSRAIDIADAQFSGADPSLWRAHARLHMSVFLRRKNRYTEAVRMCREAVKLMETAYGPNDPRIAEGLVALAYCLQEGERFHEEGLRGIEPLYRRAIGLLEKMPTPNRCLLHDAWSLLDGLLASAERRDEAKEARKRAKEWGMEHG